jgi:hypothetical protein
MILLTADLSCLEWFSVEEYIAGMKDVRTAVIVLGIAMIYFLRKLTK